MVFQAYLAETVTDASVSELRGSSDRPGNVTGATQQLSKENVMHSTSAQR